MALGIIVLIMGILLIIIGVVIDSDASLAGFLGGICISVAILVFVNCENSPDSIDVYRNKTELKIEGYYQKDSTFVVTDSIVVFKE